MGKNLTGKTVFIVAVLLIFVYGIFGIPKGGLRQSLENRIHLGLDLKGGTHLVLEVHVNEAIASAVDRDAVRLASDLQAAGISGATAARSDASRPETIIVTGIPANKLTDARGVFNGVNYNTYDAATLADGTATLTMKVSSAHDLAMRTMDTSIETIRERIDKIGVR